MCRNFLKARAALMWRRFIRENFSSPKQVEQVFGCATSTAYRWWSGDDAPDIYAFAQAWDEKPEQLREAFNRRDAG